MVLGLFTTELWRAVNIDIVVVDDKGAYGERSRT